MAPRVTGYSFALTGVSGQSNNTYNFLSLFNPGFSGEDIAVLHAEMSVYGVSNTNIATPYLLARTTAASSGTLQSASAINKFRTSFPNPVAEVRTGDPVVTATATVWHYVPPIQTANPTVGGSYDQGAGLGAVSRSPWGPLILAPGEGVVFRQTDQGDSDQRMNFLIAWGERD